MATNNQRGLQVRGLRRSASGKQSSTFGAPEVARSGNNRDLFPSGGSNTNNSTSRVIPQKPNLKYQQPQSFQNQPANYRDKVQIEGSSAFSSSRGNTGVVSESKLQRSSSLSSSSSSTQQDYKLEPSSSLPLKSKTLTQSSSIFSPNNETSSRYIKHNEDVLNDILAPPAIERAHTPSNSHHHSPTTFTHQQADKLNNSNQGRQSNHSETIIIHVCDEARGVNRDFPCERKTLLAEMRLRARHSST
jgi:hypothetical protein